METNDILDWEHPGLHFDEVNFFHLMARHAFRYVEKQRPQDLRTQAPKSLPIPVRVATLSLNLPHPADFVRTGREHDPAPALLQSGTPYQYIQFDSQNCLSTEALQAHTELFLRECTCRGISPHFLLLSELSSCFHDFLEKLAQWQELAARHSIYIVPGTFHDPKTCFALAPIIAPEKKLEPLCIAKQCVAHRYGERTRTPAAKSLQVFHTDYANLIVSIGTDLCDPALAFRYLNSSRRHLTLIASYNNDHQFLMDLSRFSNSAIICANSLDLSLGRLDAFGYLAGQPMRALWQTEVAAGGDAPLFKANVFEFDFADPPTSSSRLAITPGARRPSAQFDTIMDGPKIIQAELMEPSSELLPDLLGNLEEFNAELIAYLARHPEQLYLMQPRRFEELVAAILSDMGYEVELTPPTHDGGRDILAVLKLPHGGRSLTIVECKRFAPGRPVGIDLVERFMWVIDRKDNASGGLIATTSHLSKEAETLARTYRYRLAYRDFDGLKEWLSSFGTWTTNRRGSVWLPAAFKPNP